jgi:beta propeller repeat protein
VGRRLAAGPTTAAMSRPGRWLVRLLALLVAAPALLPAGGPPAAAAAPVYRVERTLSLPVAGEVELLISGSTLLWWEPGPVGLGRITGLDLRTNRRLPLPAPGGAQRQPALAGPIAAWIETDPATDRPQLIAYDLEVQRRTVVTGPPALPDHPAVDNTTIVWRDHRAGRPAIYSYDLVSGVERLIAAGSQSYGPPAISGRHIVWEQYDGDSWDVAVHDLTTGQTATLAGGPDDQVSPQVAGGRVVYEHRPAAGGPPSLKLVTAGGEPPVTLTSDHLITAPAIAGNLVVWEDWRDGVSGIFVYDIARRQEQPVTRAEGARRPVVDGLTVAWVNQTPFGAVIAVAGLRPVLPTERRDPPLQPDPNVLYFPETGHTLGYGFKSFWQQHGGLPVFGYPLTEEFSEPDPASGRARTVQYFERFLLEYDPSEREPARQVKIARLGAEWLADRLPPRLPPVEDEADRRYFPETGHTLAAGFKHYWDSHDGLRLLGFPISEEMDEGGRTVQYFERGRLEYDPAASDPRAQVVPGQLGREVLIARGWLPSGRPPSRPPPGRGPR